MSDGDRYNQLMTDRESIIDLIDAARKTNLSRVKEILSRNIDPNVQDKQKQTALPVAVSNARHNEDDAILIVEALLEAGADINIDTNGCLPPLWYAAFYRHRKMLAYLIEKGANVNHRDAEGKTVLAWIDKTPDLRRNNKRVIKTLEEAGGVR